MVSGPSLTKRERFDLRMDSLPPSTMTNVVVMTDERGKITGWSIGVFNKFEGAHEHLDISEEQPE